jgi:hypothetical protein
LLGPLGLRAHPDTFFGDLPAPVLRTDADVSAFVRAFPLQAPALGFYLSSDVWSFESIPYKACANNPNFVPFWYVVARYGGPAIHFIPAFGFPKLCQDQRLTIGSFSDFSYYISQKFLSGRESDYGTFNRPEGLSRAMAEIRRFLRKNGEYVVSPHRRRAIAMTDAARQHYSGLMLCEGSVPYSANPRNQ